MSRQSIVEYFRSDSRPPAEIAIVCRRGYRMVRWPYSRLYRSAADFAARLRSLGIARGDRVLLWGDNSGQWISAFLGCVFCGAVVVPIDATSQPAFARRVAQQSGARLLVADRSLPTLDLPIPGITLEEVAEAAGSGRDFAPSLSAREDPVEIVYTSGATAEPRGVVLTHANLLANLEPIEKEIARYRRYERFVHPLRFLNLLPLSHVFGQMLGIFLPQIVGATSVFPNSLNPAGIVRAIRDERVSVLVTVPRLIESLKDQIERESIGAERLARFRLSMAAADGEHFLKRWWRFRAIHRLLGWKFWAIVSGGATLPAEAETFWTRLGYAVIQGYGLTETASLVSLNHPFRLGRGSIGKALPGREVKLAEDGEILVRGESVARAYWKDSQPAPVLDEQGWFHTGDIGERDSAGNFYFKGRGKNVIVTAEGLNIYPEDLEAELRKESAVRDCIVVGLDRAGNSEPCAVLLLRHPVSNPEDAAAGIVRAANRRLAPFQQIRRWMVWPDSDFPRTPTQKPLLLQIKRVAQSALAGEKQARLAGPDSFNDILGRIGAGPSRDGGKLQLTSIERVELFSALENRYQLDLSEAEFTNCETVGDVEQLLRQPELQSRPCHYPRWAQRWPVRFFRDLVLNLLARPAMLLLGWPRILGRDNLKNVPGPVLVIANHVSFLDAAYLREALPGRIRRRLAIAMDGERLESLRTPPPGTNFFHAIVDRASYWLVVSIYNVFPLPLHSGFRKSFAFAGSLIDRGWSVLIFPEGRITPDGSLSPFRSGIGLLATRLSVPVVPVRLAGLYELKKAGKKWARPGQIELIVGSPVSFSAADPPEQVAQDLERRMGGISGAIVTQRIG